ncbi:MAG TPA: SRPBCC family protein [Ktedonobacterales bacterium]|jgi:uncharacterized protein YndB with AHSA1/START domain
MSTITVEASRIIKAPPETVFNLLADYNKRQQLLTDNFQDCAVEQGGRGAGTIFRYRFRAARRERDYRMQVTTPQPGRELREQDTNSSLVTTWAIRPTAQGLESDVTITTIWEGSEGIGGFFERTFAPGELKHIYEVMLDRLALLATSGAGQPQPVG